MPHGPSILSANGGEGSAMHSVDGGSQQQGLDGAASTEQPRPALSQWVLQPLPGHECMPLKARLKADKLFRAAKEAQQSDGLEDGSGSDGFTSVSHSSSSNSLTSLSNQPSTPSSSANGVDHEAERTPSRNADDGEDGEEEEEDGEEEGLRRSKVSESSAAVSPRSASGRSKSSKASGSKSHGRRSSLSTAHSLASGRHVDRQGGSSSTTASEDGDPSLSKKEIRMMKNRESAARSRKRKRDMMEQLESSVEELKRKNDELKTTLNRYIERYGPLEEGAGKRGAAAGMSQQAPVNTTGGGSMRVAL